MRIALIAQPGDTGSGLGRHANALERALRAQGQDVVVVHPIVPLPRWLTRKVRRWLSIDLEAFFTSYPFWAHYPPADVYHLASDNLATLLLFHRPRGKVVVTVHHLLPYTARKGPRFKSLRSAADWLFDRIGMIGLKRADHLIAISHYTRQCVGRHLGLASERIDVVYQGVDHVHFRPL